MVSAASLDPLTYTVLTVPKSINMGDSLKAKSVQPHPSSVIPTVLANIQRTRMDYCLLIQSEMK